MEATLLGRRSWGHELSLADLRCWRRSIQQKAAFKSCSSHRAKAVIVTKSQEEAAALQATTVYDDNWFNRIAIRHLSHSLQDTSGIRNGKEGYDGLVEAASQVWRNFKMTEQHQLVIQALGKAFPSQILTMIRTVLSPQSKSTRELFAVITTIFFYWLVGPCEVKATELDGRRERSVTYIKKCRFLEESKCVGMCINLCKIPSQKFIKDSFGVPLTMVPNFEDMSCEMRFGVEPPAAQDDPAMTQPCYSFCKLKRSHNKECSSITKKETIKLG